MLRRRKIFIGTVSGDLLLASGTDRQEEYAMTLETATLASGTRSASRLLRPLAAAAAAIPSLYLLVVRPWHLRWGATDAEVRQPLPGDELVPESKLVATRAISIRAPASQVWPWLVQLGQGRAGLYSYEWLENLAGTTPTGSSPSYSIWRWAIACGLAQKATPASRSW
jgi:hypothetical protein